LQQNMLDITKFMIRVNLHWLLWILFYYYYYFYYHF